MADLELSTTAVSAVGVDLGDLRDRLRIELHDEDSGNYRWTDATLNQHLARAVRELSFAWPREQKDTLSTVAGSRDIDISGLADLVLVDAVEWPVGEYPPVYVQYSVYEDVLTLLSDNEPDAVEDVDVFWGSLHTVDGAGSSLPVVTEDVAVKGAAGYAALEWASFASNRANVAGVQAVEQYQRWGNERLAEFREELARLGSRARVRASGLFAPARESSSRNVVRWEP